MTKLNRKKGKAHIRQYLSFWKSYSHEILGVAGPFGDPHDKTSLKTDDTVRVEILQNNFLVSLRGNRMAIYHLSTKEQIRV